jgi:branched-chain amino acid transport system ATP-binding protein
MSLLELAGLELRHGQLEAVRSVSLSIGEGEVIALVGANGAGKTTLLRGIAGAHRPAAGTISFASADVTRTPAHKRVAIGIALVPEGRRLFPNLTVEENLRVAAQRSRAGRWSVETVSKPSRCSGRCAVSGPRRCRAVSSRRRRSAAR